MRLGGEIRDPQRDRSLWHRRALFVESLDKAAPQIRESLMAQVYPVFLRARVATQPLPPPGSSIAERTWLPPPSPPKGVSAPLASVKFGPRVTGAVSVVQEPQVLRDWMVWSFEAGDWEEESLRSHPAHRHLSILRETLLQWASSWRGICAAWMLDVAFRTLVNWDHGVDLGQFAPPGFSDIASSPPFSFELPGRRTRAERRRSLLNALTNVVEVEDTAQGQSAAEIAARRAAAEYFGRPPCFQHRGWYPQWMPGEQYEREVRKAFAEAHPHASESECRCFRRALGRYMAQRRTAARAQGWERSPATYTRIDAEDHEHSERRSFRWLARAAGRERGTRISQTESVGASAVRRSNRRLASTIGLDW